MSSPPAESLVGRTLKHYRVDELLNRGGMGVVYRAYDLRLRRPVALKTIRPEIAADPVAFARLEREARAAAALSHPSIATLLDYDSADGVYFLVYEYLQGHSLREHARGQRLPLAAVLDIGVTVARALAIAHEAKILHRDIKPENVMVLGDGAIKVLDFGLAKLVPGIDPARHSTAGADLTSEGAIVGTLPYMSPEQLQGSELDARSDLFSLGVVLYELIAGHNPFAAPSAAETIARIMRCEPPPLGAANPAVPEGLAAVIERCLRRAPQDRPASANDLAAELAEQGASLRSGPTRRANPPAEPEYVLPRPLARALFLAIQIAYLVMYLSAFARSAGLNDGLAFALGGAGPLAARADALSGLCLALAMVGLAVRLYLMALVGWDHVTTGVRYARAFPFFFVLDELWALTPLALLETWGMLALAAIAPLVFSPFGQRTLVRSAYDARSPRRVSNEISG